MTKQKYEDKRVVTICGILDKNEDNEYIITVNEEDNVSEYSLVGFLEEMCGSVISLTSEM